ncbi:hypothetical protein AGDE_02543 [Angomonas deanei]|uniref:Uncharacterized protein n=1 Tax=Angomonas deanei TaxID=59799 RepID=S9WW47_9TRYP|nr:hypothetical protein AGDE_12118 [Angomonas deanei]EPY40220.1 hypothetical protein AGDE_03708 [Angomonas deanei]EPY40808.1 hypothetical protein AGDE_03118 [Angomonas deanei]EPY41381.1 hypothetical protein AGDE_02543 [Angomonas deanei]CAD2215533.1 Protein of unknown function (DUF778), putative [Angomonas deanei]|eukprot:EPY24895.1 hypothetical protein AGDE_12118 [Angomonas deanei]
MTDLPLPPQIDVLNEHYPFCIVWTPIPVLTWLLPFVGHIAICDSKGRIFDFQGSYRIGNDHMIFGNPVKYWDISPKYVPTFYQLSESARNDPKNVEIIKREIEDYDVGLARVIRHFRQTQLYNFFTNNCHAFVASAANEQTAATKPLNTVTVCFGMLLHGRYISLSHFLKAHLPTIILLVIIFLLVICIR